MRKTSSHFRLIGPATLAIALLVGGLVTGCQSKTLTVTVPRIERFRLSNPNALQLEIDRALSERAEAFAHTRKYAQVWRGLGLSMEPLIPPEAWIVTETLPYDTLERGQVVLFNRSLGRRVAHALVKKTSEGWITVGVNNQQIADHTRVTRRNYLGVVTAAFVADK
jgi:hypothetical protein